MILDTQDLPSDSPGRLHRLTAYRFGTAGARPKAYLQAGLHADEMPGPLILHHLRGLLATAEAAGQIRGEVILVPLANPLGFGQWVQGKPQGRQDLATMRNFNRDFPDLAALCGDALQGQLGPDQVQNIAMIRAAFGAALRDLPCPDENAALRRALLLWSHDADQVLDLHCDHHSILHLYTSPALPEPTRLLAQSIGAKLVLLAHVSGGHAFDEAHSAPFHHLSERFGPDIPIPPATFAATLEYRGQFDVGDDLAAADAANLMIFLAAAGLLDLPQAPAHPNSPQYPMAGTQVVVAPQGGIVAWATRPGDHVTTKQVLGHVTDPATGLRLPIVAPIAGMLFRQDLWRSCLRGQDLGHIAGPDMLRDGNLLSD